MIFLWSIIFHFFCAFHSLYKKTFLHSFRAGAAELFGAWEKFDTWQMNKSGTALLPDKISGARHVDPAKDICVRGEQINQRPCKTHCFHPNVIFCWLSRLQWKKKATKQCVDLIYLFLSLSTLSAPSGTTTAIQPSTWDLCRRGKADDI